MRVRLVVSFYLCYCFVLEGQTITWPTPEQTVVIDVVETPDTYYLLLDYGSKEHVFMPCLYAGTYLLSMDKTSYDLDTVYHFLDDTKYQSIHSLSYLAGEDKLLLVGNSKDSLQSIPTDIFSVLLDLEDLTITTYPIIENFPYQIGSVNKLTLPNGYTIINHTLWSGVSTPTDGNIMVSFDSEGKLYRRKVWEYDGTNRDELVSGTCESAVSDSVFYAFGYSCFEIDHHLDRLAKYERVLSQKITDKRGALQFGSGYLVTLNDVGVSQVNLNLEKIAELNSEDNTLIGSQGNSMSKSGLGFAYMVDNQGPAASGGVLARSISISKIKPELEEVWRLEIAAPPTSSVILSHGIFATEDDHAIVFGSVGTWLDQDLDAFIYIIDSDGGLVSTAEPLTEAQLHISPNPAAGYVDIEVSDLATGSRCRVTDLSGRLVLEQKLSSEATRLQIEDIPAGMYTLQLIESGRVLASEKLVKQ